MTYYRAEPDRSSLFNPILSALLSFPIACFSLTVLTDIAYIRTLNLLFLHFSEWLLLAGLVFGVAAAIVALAQYLIWRVRPSWATVACGVIVLLLATLNSFIHTADGWTAVVPSGLVVSILTVLAMILTGWMDWRRSHHV